MLIDLFRWKIINDKARLITATILAIYPPELDRQKDTEKKVVNNTAKKLKKALRMGAALIADTQIELKLGFYGKARLSQSIRNLLLESGLTMNIAVSIVEKLVVTLSRKEQSSIRKSDYATAYFNLGDFYRKQGRHEESLSAYEQAINIRPDYVKAYNNLGISLMEMDQVEAALIQFNKALAIKPEFIKALNNMGHAYLRLDKDEEAFSYFNKALAINPSYFMAHFNLGNLFQKQKKYENALASYQQVIAINPNFGDAHYSMGLLYNLLGRTQDSINSYEQAITIKADYPEALINLGNILLQLNRYNQAIDCFVKADTLRADYFEAKLNLGNVLLKLERAEDAVRYFKQALAIKPNSPETYNLLGNAYKGLSCYKDATRAYGKSLAVRPQYPDALNNIGNLLQTTGRNEEAIAYYKQAIRIKPDLAEAQSNLLFSLNYQTGIIEEDIYTAHLKYGQLLENTNSDKVQSPQCHPEVNRRLRIGYVSPDFRTHSVAYFIESVFLEHTKEKFQIFAYDNATIQDNKSRHLMEIVDNWQMIAGMNDDQVVTLIRNDAIDILVDLSGHTNKNRIGVFAMKPAPIQVGYLGYPNTTGLSTMDYRITDETSDPEGITDRYYTEELTRLPAVFLCYQPQPNSPDIGNLPASTTGYITFGSFNN